MKKKAALFALLSSTASFLLAQEEPAKFGQVSVEELEMKAHQLDTSAEAIIIFDKGELVVEPGSTTGTKLNRHKRIKIFKQSALEEWGAVHVRVEKGRFSKLKGATYNLEQGKLIRSDLGESSVFKVRFDKYTDEITFSLPNVKVGSVLEYSYTIGEEEITLPRWSFQSRIPTLWSEYSLQLPRLNFRTDIRGPYSISKYETKYDGQYQRWIMKDLPAFRPEPLMPHEDLYKSAINFWNYSSSWVLLNNRLFIHENFGKIIKEYGFLKKIVGELTAGLSDSREKIKVISNYIKENVKWDGTRDIYALDPREVLQNNKGSSADINFLLASMLEKAGFNVEMVLLSTRENGFVMEEVPSLAQFNYVTCLVLFNRDSLLLDATEKFLPFDALPERCLNHDGLRITKYGPSWISINPNKKAKTLVNADLSLNENGELTGRIDFIKEGYTGFEAREEYHREGHEVYLKGILSDNTWNVENSEILNMDNVEEPIRENFNVLISDQASISGNIIYLNPFIVLTEKINPFKEEKRYYPLDFVVPIEKVFVSNISIPAGYEVDELPKSKAIALPNNAAKSVFSVTQIGNRLQITTILQINKTIFMPDEYPDLKEFYTRLVSKKSEQIVLRKN